jgi:hypothetical protein
MSGEKRDHPVPAPIGTERSGDEDDRFSSAGFTWNFDIVDGMALDLDKSINSITRWGVDAVFFISHQVITTEGSRHDKKQEQNENDSFR